uniref:JmjC domain-containing protein n=1 Tax=Panagrellus redivivus TaxID=6233 RepID=A0A7E4UP19_PANRE
MKASKYPPMKWEIKDLSKWFKQVPIDVRIGTKKDALTGIQYEKRCPKISFKRGRIGEWLRGEAAIAGGPSNDGVPVHTGTHWGYLDYKTPSQYLDRKYAMALKFSDTFNSLKPNNNSEERFWLGTPGANTPCHYDTNGFSIHVQITGCKRWILFPPTDPMRPSRFPYVESTVYSRYNVAGGHIPQGAHPRMVDLKAGDVLFLPPKWWHCVIVMEDEKSFAAFSVSRSYSLKSDVVERAKEAVIECLMSPLQHAAEEDDDLEDVINSSRQLPGHISQLIDYENRPNSAGDDGNEDTGPSTKRTRKVDPCPMTSFYHTYRELGELLHTIEPSALSNRLLADNPFTSVEKELPLLTPGDDGDYSWREPEMVLQNWSLDLHNIFDAFCDDSTVDRVIQYWRRMHRNPAPNPNPNDA